MTLQDVFRIGPLNLPIRYLVFILSVGFGYGAMSLVLRRHRELRQTTGNWIVNALVIFVLVWKLEPLAAALIDGLLSGTMAWSSIVLQIFVPGGKLAAVLGGVAALAYLTVSLFFRKTETGSNASPTQSDARQTDQTTLARRSVGRSLIGLSSAIVPALLVYIAATFILAPPAEVGGSRQGTGAQGVIGTSVGDLAPPFEADTMSGGHIALSKMPGKVIVLNFWATWCPPCRAELPDLVKFSDKQNASRVEVWAVDMTSSEASISAVMEFAQANRLRFPVLLDRAGLVAAAYKVSAVPTTYVISATGMIVAKQVGAMSPSWLRSRVASALR